MISHNITNLTLNILTWLIWFSLLLSIGVLLAFAYSPDPDSNHWIFDYTWLIALVILLLIPLSLRFLIFPRLKNPWLRFLVFIVGVFFANTIAVVGMFSLLEGQQSFILVGVVTLFLFFPYCLSNNLSTNNIITDA